MTTTPATAGFRGWLERVIPPSARESFYRFVTAVVTGLLGFGVLDGEKAALWTQLGIGTVTLLFAILYTTSGIRIALYALVGPVGAILLAYGITQNVNWAVITASIGQALGVATAAAKAQPPEPAALPSGAE